MPPRNSPPCRTSSNPATWVGNRERSADGEVARDMEVLPSSTAEVVETFLHLRADVALDLFRSGEAHRLLEHLDSFGARGSPDDVLHHRDLPGGHRELVEP